MRPVVLYRRDGVMDNLEQAAIKRYFRAVCNRTAVPKDNASLVIGRYSVLPNYFELEEDLAFLDAQLINSYKQHSYIADLGQWYEDLKDITPKTWGPNESIPMGEPGSFVVKGQANSKKGLWSTHMFASTRADVGRVIGRLQDDGFIGYQKLYVRRFEKFHTYMEAINGQPITEEYRVFVCDGQILTKAFYWSSHIEELHEQGILPDPESIPQEFLEDVIARVGNKARFYVVDVARMADGGWMVVELNDGQMSGLSETNPDELYRNLARVLGNRDV